MAAEGMRFTQFYAGSTVCAPSRSVLLTGLHLGHNPIRGNKEIQPMGQAPLPDSVQTVAEALGGAGYETALVGKSHTVSTRRLELHSRQCANAGVHLYAATADGYAITDA
jgi:arylsulfatase A-like enzyme